MAISSLIFLKNNDGSYEGIHCMTEGQVEGGVGETLYNVFDTKEKVSELVSFGNAFALSDSINDCEFIERDQSGEFENFEAVDDEDLEYITDRVGVDMVYKFDNDEWYFSEQDGSGVFEWQSLNDIF